VPAMGEARLAVQVRFPEGTTQLTPPQGLFSGNAYVERWRIFRKGGLAGQAVGIDGIASGVTDVIVRIERQDGTSQVERLLPQKPQFIVKAATGSGEVARSYLLLGIEHILAGYDHLLFVLALLLIVHGGLRVLATLTAFTVAHGITLAAAVLGWVHVPGPPVEAIIALSIVFVAAEAVHGLRGRPGLTARAPWLVAFSFGLLHGLGFAGTFVEVGLPQKAVPLALLMVNVGVEAGQLLVVATLLAARVVFGRGLSGLPAWSSSVPPYVIGTVAMFWVIERIGAFWS
ncbi:MAG TPA: HupE/UreJ family protein, partial [Burkholderiales bacterium]|nr:HupE/UreJ family protein [Burkholderiales bacterium]